MIQAVRSFFGLGRSSTKRTVLGNRVPVDRKEAECIQGSNERLAHLHHLVSRYKGTPYAHKLKAVYEKTKNIHTYLVAKKRTHELELFHIQHTDHFINTFTVILDAVERQKGSSSTERTVTENTITESMISPPKAESKAEILLQQFESEKIRRRNQATLIPEMVKRTHSPGSLADTEELKTEVPSLSAPAIAINTYSRIVYLKEDATHGLIANEIGFTSTKQEKEAFLLNVSARLGIDKLGMSYFGNAMVKIANSNGSTPTGYVPILHWKGYTYALNLNDYRLFPVRIHGRSL